LSLSLGLVPTAHAPVDASAPRGTYVEARTASVFAGACHYGGEATTAGREALVAWHVEEGAFDGVDLAGLSIAALVASNANLADGEERRSVVFVDRELDARRTGALLRWLGATRGELLGDVELVRSCALDVQVGEDGYRAVASGIFTLEGAPMPDRACCKMPFQVWYRPFEELTGRLVGRDTVFDVIEPALSAAWSRPDENAAFQGRFGDVRS
jgi:hypothetical protein